MKVLIVNPSFYVYGGAERQIRILCNYLTSKGIENTILSAPPMVPEMKRDLIDTRLIETNNIRDATQLLMHDFDIINTHNHPAELCVYPRHIHHIWTCNEPPIQVLQGGKLDEKEVEVVKDSVDVGVAIDEFNAKRFEELYGLKAKVNYPGVGYDFYSEEYEPKDIYGIKDNFTLIQCGMLTFTKNQIQTVEIFAEIKKKIPEAKLILAGYDKLSYAMHVQSKIRELKLTKDVIITGYIEKDEDLRDLVKCAKVKLTPIIEQGGWANTFEAIVAGKPTIVSDRATFSNLVKDNNLGVVTKIENFPETILNVYENYEKYEEHAKKGREWIKNNLTWDKYGERMIKIYDEYGS
jgi:glycosyltransferase involved in cell wall biosynthesis